MPSIGKMLLKTKPVRRVDPVGLLVDRLELAVDRASWRKFLATVMPLIASWTVPLTWPRRAAPAGGAAGDAPEAQRDQDDHRRDHQRVERQRDIPEQQAEDEHNQQDLAERGSASA